VRFPPTASRTQCRHSAALLSRAVMMVVHVARARGKHDAALYFLLEFAAAHCFRPELMSGFQLGGPTSRSFSQQI
jgi:hypothetical protein